MHIVAAITEGTDAFIAFTVMVLAIAITLLVTISR
jgi:hypothetical protein